MQFVGCEIKGLRFTRDHRTINKPRARITHGDIQHASSTGLTASVGLGENNYTPEQLLCLLLKQVPIKITGRDLRLRAELVVAHYGPNGDKQKDFAVFAIRLIPTHGELIEYVFTDNGTLQETRFYRPSNQLFLRVNDSLTLELLLSKPNHQLAPLNVPAGPVW